MVLRVKNLKIWLLLNEPHHKKNRLLRFRPDPTQIRLYNTEDGHRFDLSDLGSKQIILSTCM